MSVAAIFALGVFVTLIVAAAMFAIGLGEAADTSNVRREDLADWELELVRAERERRRAESDGS